MIAPTLISDIRSPIRLIVRLDTYDALATRATWQVSKASNFSTTVSDTTATIGWTAIEYAVPGADIDSVFYVRAKTGYDAPVLDELGDPTYDENGDPVTSPVESAWSSTLTVSRLAVPTTPTITVLESAPQRIGAHITNFPSDASEATFQFSATDNASTRWDAGNIVKEMTTPGAFYEYRVAEANRERTHYVRAKVSRVEDFESDGDPVKVESSWSSTLTVTRAGAIRPIDFDYDITSYTTAGTYTYTVPDGARQIRVTLVGGGGGGAGGNGKTSTSRGGGGGGGGMLIERWLVVTPGTNLTVTVGAGGNGGTGGGTTNGQTSGANGGATSISYGGTTLLKAYGGKGGAVTNGSGGAGGGTLDQSSATPSGWIGASNSTATTPEYGGGGGGQGTISATGTAGGDSAHGGGAGGGGGGVSSGTGYGGGTGGAGSKAGPIHAGSVGLAANSIAASGGGGDDATDPIFCGGGGGGGGAGTTQDATGGRNGGKPGGGGGGGGAAGTGYNGASGGGGGAGAAYILAI